MPFIVVTMPLPQTCIGPLVLGPSNIVIAVPLIIVDTPEPQTAVGAGELLDVVLAEHGHGVLDGCIDTVLTLGIELVLSPRRDEIMPGTARIPEAEDVETGELELSGGQGHIQDELEGAGAAVITCTDGGGAD